MSIAKPIAKPLLGLLILAALAAYAAISFSLSSTPFRPSITLPQKVQTDSRTNSGNGQSQAPESSQPSQPSATDAVQKSSGSGTPADSSSRPAGGVTRFADGGPDVVGPAAAQTESCGPKPCPRPLR